MQHPTTAGSERIRIAQHDSEYIKSVALCVMLLFVSLAGCEKVPTWQELTKEDEKQDTNLPVKKDELPPKAETKTAPLRKPVAPPKPTPEEVIAGFKSLKPHEVHDHELQQLAKLKSKLDEFVALDLQHSQVSDAGLAVLEHFPRLRELNLDGVRFTAQGMAAVTRVKTLDKLSLRGAPHPKTHLANFDQGLQQLSGMPQLKELDLTNVRLTAAGLSSLRSLVHLERLLLDKTTITDAGLIHLRRLVNLKQLDIGGTQITDAGFVHLSPLVRLESMNISWNRIDGSGFRNFRHGKLKFLAASDTNFALNGLKFIRKSKSLEELILHRAMVTDLGCKWIAQMPNLRRLHLSANIHITSTGVSFLKSLKKLEYLSLQGNRSVGDRGVAFLKACPNLKELNLNGTGCSPQVAEFLNERRRKKNAPPIKVIL